ncbi:zinc finger MYM-type protein 1-like, partial [Limulus polyphemus]|uniref:Zinc finger MYM-type protein 1-like n=1 Tax=Limulus polyphemus TaxID=6850 RepID=A0ABM1B9Z9_LIMPO
ADAENENGTQKETDIQVHVEVNLEDERSNHCVGLDIECIITEFPSQKEIDNYVTNGNIPLPKTFPKDTCNQVFPESIMKFQSTNGELHVRDWLVWSQQKQALYCFLCRLFWHKTVETSTSASMSALVSAEGWDANGKWQKLSHRIPKHEKDNGHRECDLAWRKLESYLLSETGVDTIFEASIKTEAVKWYNILKHIIDVVLFLGERGLAFNGSSHRIGDSSNGNFLGLIELLSRWDPILQEHVLSVEESQKRSERLQVLYLFPDSQNEFISECLNLVKQHILLERQSAKYFAVIVDATPDSSHIKQTIFL